MTDSCVKRLYTIHPETVWLALKQRGRLYVDPKHWIFDGVPPAYDWLKIRLEEFIPGYGQHYPWFAFLEQPNLDDWRGRNALWLESPTWVCIELDAEKISFLTFRSWAWNRVFCQDYLALTKEEYECWCAGLPEPFRRGEEWPPPEPWRSELELSWNRLFDPNLPSHDWDVSLPWCHVELWEAVFEYLDLADVVSARVFEVERPTVWEPWMRAFNTNVRRRKAGKVAGRENC